MPITVSKATDWKLRQFLQVPFSLIICDELTPNARLILMFLFNQCGYKTVKARSIDRLLGIHRATRIRCMTELRELGFIGGTDNHIIVNDPQPILANLEKECKESLKEVEIIVTREQAAESLKVEQAVKETPVKRDYMQEATDAWNAYRPKDYQSIRRISAQLIKAIDIHMKDNQIAPHDYTEFFSLLKGGVEQSDFWANKNSSKNLQSITGIGSPTDKKRSNVYQLLNAGFDSPAQPMHEQDRVDTIVYPAEFRPLISDYEGAQYVYNSAYRKREITSEIEEYVIRTEQALKAVGLDPAKFRLKYGMTTWPTDTPEPAEARSADWVFDDERGYAL